VLPIPEQSDSQREDQSPNCLIPTGHCCREAESRAHASCLWSAVPSRKIDSLFYKVSRLAAGVVHDLSAEYRGNVTTVGKELQDLRALTGQFGSAGFGLRVLLESAIGGSVECEVYPGQIALDGAGAA
jgi:hypothetical protein